MFVSYKTRDVKGASTTIGGLSITRVVAFQMEIAGFVQRVYAYVVLGLAFPIILGNPQKAHNKIQTALEKRRYYYGRLRQQVNKGRNYQEYQDNGSFTIVATASSKDIKKFLKPTEYLTIGELEKLLPPELKDIAPLFNKREAEKLLLYREGINYYINLRKKLDGSTFGLPQGPLYSMSQEELLVLRKSLDNLLEKGYIRPSTSKAATLVLFIRKPGGGLRFYYDYRALNAITTQDRYPLPLILETIRNLTRARQLTKVDVVAAFYKIRIALGDEYKTAFRTRFGSFGQLVYPFGLSRALVTFQQYINTLLQEYLDDFASTYLDDVIIYSNGLREDYFQKVRAILRRLQDGGLYLDLGKSEFAQKKIKYLGFIVHTDRKGVGTDLEKVEAIKSQKELKI